MTLNLQNQAEAHVSSASRSTTRIRWIVKMPGRVRSVFVPRQCLQMTRPAPRQNSHSLVKISSISLKNWLYTMPKDATCKQ